MILNSTHFFLNSSQAVEALIQPLKQYFGITSLVYQKNFDDGSEIRLSNQPNWIAFFYEYELYKKSMFEAKPSHYIKNRVLWNSIPQHSHILSKAHEFNIAHGVTFIEPAQEGCEFFFFGAPADVPGVMNRYLPRLDLLEKFIVYFRERAAPLIEQAKQHKILIPHKFDTAPLSLIKTQCSVDALAFLQALQPQLQALSPREVECAQLLLKGYTTKMIAKELNLSPRTVETHMEHIKQKTNAHTKVELIRVLSKQSFT